MKLREPFHSIDADAAMIDAKPEAPELAQEMDQPAQEGPRFAIPEWLKAQTGPGPIEDYINHPLNLSGSRGIAQVLRGLTGIVGELKYAVVDVVMGAMQWSKERRTVAPKLPAAPTGGPLQ